MAGNVLPDPTGSFEIGSQAIWSVSSCKLGNGVAQLRDNSLDTYWQSVILYLGGFLCNAHYCIPTVGLMVASHTSSTYNF